MSKAKQMSFVPPQGGKKKKSTGTNQMRPADLLRLVAAGKTSPSVGVSRWIMPQRQRVILRYTYQGVYAAAATVTNVFRMSCYDPEFTGVGAQPVGFDQWALLYQNYRVVRARGSVKAFGNTGVAFMMRSWVSASSANPATWNAAAAQPHAAVGFSTGLGGVGAELSTGWVDIPQFFGLTLDEYRSDDTMWSATGADPTTLLYWHLQYANDGVVTPVVRSDESLELDVEFFDPIQLASS